jgi:hypothetical protein
MDKAKKCEKGRVKGSDDRNQSQRKAMFKPLHGNFKVHFCDKLRQDVPGECVRLRFGGVTINPGGFESLRIGEGVDRHIISQEK